MVEQTRRSGITLAENEHIPQATDAPGQQCTATSAKAVYHRNRVRFRQVHCVHRSVVQQASIRRIIELRVATGNHFGVDAFAWHCRGALRKLTLLTLENYSRKSKVAA